MPRLAAACLIVSLGWIPVACGPRTEPNSAVQATVPATSPTSPTASENKTESGDRSSFYIAAKGVRAEPSRGQRGRGDFEQESDGTTLLIDEVVLGSSGGFIEVDDGPTTLGVSKLLYLGTSRLISITLSPPLTKDTKVFARVQRDHNSNGTWDEEDEGAGQVLHNGDELVIALVLKIKQG